MEGCRDKRQEVQVASRNWKKQGNRHFPRDLRDFEKPVAERSHLRLGERMGCM